MPGEGIGVEVMAAALAVLDAVEARFGLAFGRDDIPAARITTGTPARPCCRTAWRARDRPTRSCSAPWAGPTSATRTAPRSRRSSTCASPRSSTPGVRPVRAIPGRAAAARRSARERRSTSSSCANRPRACSPRAARARSIDDRRGARHHGHHARGDASALHEFAFAPGEAAQARRGTAGPRDLRRQGERVPLLRLHAQGLRRGAARHPGRRGRGTTTSTPWRSTWCAGPGISTCCRPRTCSATSCPTSAPGWSAAWAWRRRPTSATSMRLFQPSHGIGAGHRRPGQGQPDGDAPVGGA